MPSCIRTLISSHTKCVRQVMHFDQIRAAFHFFFFVSISVILSLATFFSHCSLSQLLLVVIECIENEIKSNQILQNSISVSMVCNRDYISQQKRCKIEFIYNLFVNERSLWFTVIYDCINIPDERTVTSMGECICACSGINE